ncbi:MAG: response regulator [Alphaproteobacteria bacterium]|nr:response regulator [Alphaproteobacteria bacterium]
MPAGDTRLLRLLLVDDDTDDQLLMLEALQEAEVPFELHVVSDGNALRDFLDRKGEHEHAPRPSLVLLDLNMPGLNGFDVLRSRNDHALLRRLPVVVMSASWSERDIALCHDLGVNSFITKPVTFDQLVDTVRGLAHYWLDVCELPSLDVRV